MQKLCQLCIIITTISLSIFLWYVLSFWCVVCIYVCVCVYIHGDKSVLIYKDMCGGQRLVKGLSFLVAALLYHFESVSVILARLAGPLFLEIHLSITSSPENIAACYHLPARFSACVLGIWTIQSLNLWVSALTTKPCTQPKKLTFFEMTCKDIFWLMTYHSLTFWEYISMYISFLQPLTWHLYITLCSAGF